MPCLTRTGTGYVGNSTRIVLNIMTTSANPVAVNTATVTATITRPVPDVDGEPQPDEVVLDELELESIAASGGNDGDYEGIAPPDTFEEGELYTITWSAIDPSGNEYSGASRVVGVVHNPLVT